MTELTQTDICNLKVMVDDEIVRELNIIHAIEGSGNLFDSGEHLWHTDRVDYLNGLCIKLKNEIIL